MKNKLFIQIDTMVFSIQHILSIELVAHRIYIRFVKGGEQPIPFESAEEARRVYDELAATLCDKN